MFGSHVGRQNADELPLCQQESTILSDDLIVYIITFLPDDIETLKILESISKQFRNAATSEMLWKKIFEQRHGYKNIQIQNYRYACLELQRYAIQQVHNKIKKNEAQEYRIIFAGNNGVGKEALQQRICGDYFVQEPDNYRKVFTINNKNYFVDMINVDLDDDVYIPIKKQHCRYGHGYILICAINDRKSFEELESFVHLVYLEKDYIDDRLVPMILVVTKSDSHERQISNAELKEFVERHSLGGCVITSAKDGTNCQEAILQMLQVIKYRFMPREIIEKVGKGLSVTESQKKCNIC